jgi:hypothetical protein
MADITALLAGVRGEGPPAADAAFRSRTALRDGPQQQ